MAGSSAALSALPRLTPRAPRTPRASLAVSRSLNTTPLTATATARKPQRQGTGPRWRPSLLDGSYRSNVSMSQREDLIRGPASVALEGLCAVGKADDEDSGDLGPMTLSSELVGQYEAFKSLKKTYLSSSLFLSSDKLTDAHPDALRDPQSSLNTLMKLSNLTTFLYLVLSSAPGPNGDRDRSSLTNWREAATAFLNHVVPVDSQIHDGALKMLVGLNCQAYLAASAHQRNVQARVFFANDLHTYLHANPSSSPQDDPLARREASIRFQQLQSDAVALINKVGGDRQVLETQWKYDDLARELRNYCESIARRVGAISDEFDLEDEDEESQEDDMMQVENRQSSVSTITAGRQSQTAVPLVEETESDEEDEDEVPPPVEDIRVREDTEDFDELDEKSEQEADHENQAVAEEEELDEDDREDSLPPSDLSQYDLGAIKSEDVADVERYEDVDELEANEEDEIASEAEQIAQHDVSDDSDAEVAQNLGALTPRQFRQSMSNTSRKLVFGDAETQDLRETAQRDMTDVFLALETDDDEEADEGEEEQGEMETEDGELDEMAQLQASRQEERKGSDELQETAETQLPPNYLQELLQIESLTEDDSVPKVESEAEAVVEETYTQTPINNAALFLQLTQEEEDELEASQAEATQIPENNLAAFQMLTEDEEEDSADEDDAEDTAGLPQPPITNVAAQRTAVSASTSTAGKTRLAVIEGNLLQRVAEKPRAGPSMFERQNDAERIQFDSQGDSPLSPPPVKKTKRAKVSAKPTSTTTTRQAPEPSRRRITRSVSAQPVELPRSRQRARDSLEPELDDFDAAAEAEQFQRTDSIPLNLGRYAEVALDDFDHDNRDFGDSNTEERAGVFYGDPDDEEDDTFRPRLTKLDKGKGRAIDNVDDAPLPHAATSSKRRASAVANPAHTADPRSKQKERRRSTSPSLDQPQYTTDTDSDDSATVRRNRRQPRRDPADELTDAIQPTVRSQRATSVSMSKKRRRRERELADVPEVDPQVPSQSRRSKQRRRTPVEATSDMSDTDDDYDTRSPKRPSRNVRNGRVPWTAKEERCLMQAMSEHHTAYANILKLHGVDGAKSRILAARSQVDLKDKAVNIKVGLVRAGREVPWFLEGLSTGNKLRNVVPSFDRD